MEAAAIAALTVLMGAVLISSPDPRRLVIYGIGFTGAFDTLQVSGLHVTTALTGILLLRGLATEERNRRALHATTILVSASLLASSALYGSLVNSRNLGAQLLLLASTTAVLVLCLRPTEEYSALSGLLMGILLQCGIAGLQLLHVIDPHYFVDSSGLRRVHAFYREPDFLAFYAAVGLVLALRLPLKRGLRTIVGGVCLVTMTLTFARGAFIALAVSAAFLFVRRSSTTSLRVRRFNPSAAAVALGVLTLVIAVNTSVGDTLTHRVSVLFDPAQRDASVMARVGQTTTLLQLAEAAPWHGYGLSAGGRVTGIGQINYGLSPNNVATNWVLDIWVGGKLLAIPLMLLVAGAALRTRRTIAGQVLVLAAINSLISNVFFLPIFWLALGMAVLSLTHRDRRGQSPNCHAGQGSHQ